MKFLSWLLDKYLTFKTKVLVKKTIKLLLKYGYLPEDYALTMTKKRMDKIIDTVKKTIKIEQSL